MRIRLYDGDREALRHLFRLADDSDREIDGYMAKGEVLVAEDGGEIVGQLLLTPTDEPGAAEVKSLAVLEERQRAGIGRALIDDAAERSRRRGANRLLVSTAAASTGDLRFYQRAGFRMLRVERDVFGPEQGYADGIVVEGIPLRDRVWLDRAL
jgi:ribosomal protein S18 acetylase RimI-like enzyme